MSSGRGIIYAIAAYGLWGALPVYWKIMAEIPAREVLAHRMAWSLPFVLLLLILRRNLRFFLKVIRQWKVLGIYLATATILTTNWYTYIYAVNSDRIVDASLGYFINPLLTVMLGVVFLRERPRTLQWISFILALCGVLYLTFVYGSFPWIGLILAFTFGAYGLIRKTAVLNSLDGLTLESAFMFLPALTYLLVLETNGTGIFGHTGATVTTALAMTGAITAIPLILFAAAVRRTKLTTIGLLQYIAPTLQFLSGVVLFAEPISRSRLMGFIIIWIALAMFSIEGVFKTRGRFRTPPIP
ncbi:EamA family transporter RarD [Candidatus Neomarinimicrobiota bacterium]